METVMMVARIIACLLGMDDDRVNCWQDYTGESRGRYTCTLPAPDDDVYFIWSDDGLHIELDRWDPDSETRPLYSSNHA
jgi:hypothetical protein